MKNIKNILFFTTITLMVVLSALNFKYNFIGKFLSKSLPSINNGLTFDKDTINFGNLEEGLIGKFQFSYVNKSEINIKITSVKSSCECTIPQWSTLPIPAKQRGVINVEYNSYGKNGEILVPILLTTDGYPKYCTIYLKGKVIPFASN